MSGQPDKNFQWLYATAQTNASIGTSYSYGDANLPSWAMLGEYDNGSASGAGRVEYIWLPTDDGSAIPMAMLRGNRFYSIHSDHLGTPRLIKDDTAKPTWQWAYSAFGDNKPTGILKATTNPNAAITNQPNLLQATGAMEFNLRFPGQYFDSESGHFYNTYRSLMPGQGRYTQNDLIGLDGGWNRYGYVDANPLSLIDPLGLASCHYSISTGQLVCMPNGSERSTFQGSFASGNNSTPGCKNNWECQGVSNVGPLPEGVYEWTGRGRKSPDRRNLTPLFGTQYGRSAFQTHSCLNPFGASPSQKGACSNGCITGSPETVRRLNELLDREPRSILTVTP